MKCSSNALVPRQGIPTRLPQQIKSSLAIVLLVMMLHAVAYSQTVTISGNKFMVGSNQIFFNGVNTPWQYQSDGDISFLKKNFDVNWWNTEFQTEANNKINMCRIWIHGTGYYTPSINADGTVNAYASNDSFWTQMDALVNAAAQKNIYLLLTFWSFDMVKDNTAYYQRYRNLIIDDTKIDTYINNFLIPFVQRYGNSPYVFGYDICNEPEHMWRDANCGNISSYWVTRFLAKCAAAINQNTSKPVTVGTMWVIYNSPNFGSKDEANNAGWNRYTNANLQQYYSNSNAYLDFYCPHWYGWQYDNSTSGPFERTVTNWIGTDDRPVLIGETFGGDMSYISMANYYKQSYTNGFDGVCGWRNPNGNDGYGTFSGITVGTNDFYSAYPSLVYPGGSSSCTTTILPGTIQAENYCNMSGIQTETTTDTGGGQDVGYIDTGDWMTYSVNVPTSGTYQVNYRVASLSGGGSIRLEQAGGGTVYGTISVPSTGGWQTWTTISQTVTLTAGSQQLGIAVPAGGFNLNWFSLSSTASSANLAYNRPVYVSSTESASYPASYAVDANGTTRWSSAYADPQYFIVDLGANYNVNRVKISWEAAYGKNFQIQFSTDNVNWTTVTTITNNTSLTNDITGLSGTARYVKMYGYARGTTYGYSMWEFEVYGSSAGRVATEELARDENDLLTFYPNPVVNEGSLVVNMQKAGRANISLIGMLGNIHQIHQGWLEEGKHTFMINADKFSAGVYNCMVLLNGNKVVKKILIQH